MSLTKLKQLKYLQTALLYLIFGIIVLIIITPIAITVFAAFKTKEQIAHDFPLIPPVQLYLDNFFVVFDKGNLITGYFNSFLIVIITLIINTLLASMVSYCLSRFNFRLKKFFLALFMLGMLLPIYVTEVSRFGVIQALHLYNTRWAAILIYSAADLMQIFIYLQFINQIPKEIDESAFLDGCSYYQIYFRMILPLSIPAMATLWILKSVEIINDMYIPYLYMPSNKLVTVTTAIMRFAGTRFARWEYMAAAILLVMAPTVLLYLFLQDKIIKGISAGAIKG
jgi:raffinose/stachyose/melibiose transport system permease protein